jgi:hypothetical protein
MQEVAESPQEQYQKSGFCNEVVARIMHNKNGGVRLWVGGKRVTKFAVDSTNHKHGEDHNRVVNLAQNK